MGRCDGGFSTKPTCLTNKDGFQRFELFDFELRTRVSILGQHSRSSMPEPNAEGAHTTTSNLPCQMESLAMSFMAKKLLTSFETLQVMPAKRSGCDQLAQFIWAVLLNPQGSPNDPASFSRRKIRFTSLPIKLSSPIDAMPPIATDPTCHTMRKSDELRSDRCFDKIIAEAAEPVKLD
jgi:hypothetical protein